MCVVMGQSRRAVVQEPALGPRLCHLSKWNTFEGYGFNLHADKKRLQHFIGQVDPGSPADLGGLRRNDRLVEVRVYLRRLLL